MHVMYYYYVCMLIQLAAEVKEINIFAYHIVLRIIKLEHGRRLLCMLSKWPTFLNLQLSRSNAFQVRWKSLIYW